MGDAVTDIKRLLDMKMTFKTEELLDLNGRIWKAKKDKGLSLKAEVEKVIVPEKFKPIEKELRSMHNLASVEYGKAIRIHMK